MSYPRSARVLALLALVALAVFAQQGPYVPYEERLADGVVNWDEGWIRADASVPLSAGIPPAQARVNAQRVAVLKAQAAALRIALRLPVDSEERLESFEVLRIHVKGVVAGGQIVSEGLKDGVYALSLKVPVNGVRGIVAEVSKVTLPPQPPSETGPQSGAGQAAPKPGAPAEPPKPQGVASFASVTVDARDAGVKPALQPRILDPQGNVVYGVKTVKPLVARDRTLARYVTQGSPDSGHATWLSPQNLGPIPLALITPPWELMAQAQRPPTGRQRGAPETLEVKAASASGKLKADIVVTEETARRLREAEAASGVLSDAKVVVVVRADVGGVESRFRLRGDAGPPALASK